MASSSASTTSLAPSPSCHINQPLPTQQSEQTREKKDIPFSKPHVDILRGAERIELPVLDHGFIALVDCMPRLVPEGSSSDFAIVQAARVSYGVGTKTPSTDTGLVKYLLRHRHTTPFEMVVLKFHIRMPLFVARQWLRHRTASVNEYSARYSILPDLFYTPSPDSVRQQSQTNRQGKTDAEEGGDCSSDALAFFESYISRQEEQYSMYTTLLEKHKVSREIARIGLPQNIYTEFYWQCNLHNILHFLSLRMDKHAQEEIRQNAMCELCWQVVPTTMKAFETYMLNGMHLTALEIEAIASGGDMELKNTDNQREKKEWEEKKQRLFPLHRNPPQ